MKRRLIIVTLLLVLTGGIATALSPLGSDRFTDVPEGHYADEAIGWAVDQGITSGCGTDEFCPDQPVTRAQIVTFLHRFASNTTTTTPIDPEWPVIEKLDCYILPSSRYKSGHVIATFSLVAPTPIERATVVFDLLDGGQYRVSTSTDGLLVDKNLEPIPAGEIITAADLIPGTHMDSLVEAGHLEQIMEPRVVTFSTWQMNWSAGFIGPHEFDYRWWIEDKDLEWNTCTITIRSVSWA